MFQSSLARNCHLFRPLTIISSIKSSMMSPIASKITSAQRYSTSSPAMVGRIDLETAKKMPRNYDEMPNDVLLTMAVMGDQEAREERLIREIMAVDNVSWEEAQPQFLKIVERNRAGLFLISLPYKVGIATAVGAGVLSVPLVFEYNLVLLFNDLFVTTDVPEAKDLETPLEVGTFAWGWMEPPLGTVSFFLLCMQFARSQLQNLGAKPYTGWVLDRRSSRMCREFPQYSSFVLRSFSEGDSLNGDPINH